MRDFSTPLMGARVKNEVRLPIGLLACGPISGQLGSAESGCRRDVEARRPAQPDVPDATAAHQFEVEFRGRPPVCAEELLAVMHSARKIEPFEVGRDASRSVELLR